MNQWLLLAQDGHVAIPFTSLLDLTVTNEGQVLSTPAEDGQVQNYNKVQSSADITVNVGVDGTPAELDAVLQQLKDLQQSTEQILLVTPGTTYEDLILSKFKYTRSLEKGATILAIELTLKEKRDVEDKGNNTLTGIKIKSPTSASSVDRGKVKTTSIVQGKTKSGTDTGLKATLKNAS